MQVVTLDTNGLNRISYNEIKTLLQERFLEIQPNIIFRGTPAGDIVNIATDVIDNLADNILSIFQQLQLIYSEGVMLDVLGQLQGVSRLVGSKTIQDIIVETNRIITLVGSEFRVKDATQNIYVLQDTQTNLPIGTHLLTFVAESEGAIESGLNTINIIDTPQVGVVSVNNTTAPTFVGTNFENDVKYKTRLALSKQINALGYIGSLIAQLLNIENVILANAIDNKTDTVDIYGIPARHTACVIEGGDENVIAETISKYTNLPTFGDIGIDILLPNNLTQIFYFSRPINVPIYAKIEIKNTGNYPNLDFIKEIIVEEVGFAITSRASSDRIIQIIKNIPNINIVVYNTLISLDDISYVEEIENNSYKTRYVFDFDKITFDVVV